MGPRGARVDREARRAVAARLSSRGVLDGLARAREIGAELFGGEGEDAVMVPAVAGDLVPGLGDAAISAG